MSNLIEVTINGITTMRHPDYESFLADDLAHMVAQQESSSEAPVPTPEDDLNWLRSERDSRLLAVDWTQFPDVPEATKLKWQPYRQALRDITESYSDMSNVTWPVKPT